MKLICKKCGSTEIERENDLFVCRSCGEQYTKEEMRDAMIAAEEEIAAKAREERRAQRMAEYAEEAKRAKEEKAALEEKRRNAFVIEYGVELKKYQGDEKHVVIPREVTRIARRAFDNTGIESVVIPDTVKLISTDSFFCENSLLSVTIRGTDVMIEDEAFYGIPNLKEVTAEPKVAKRFLELEGFDPNPNRPRKIIEVKDVHLNIPEGKKCIEKEAFDNCNDLTTITLPKSLVKIEQQAFRKCYHLTSIEIPEGIKVIEDETFRYCNALESVTLPSTLESIGVNAFSGCSQLTTINLPAGVKLSKASFGACKSLPQETIAKIKSIEPKALEETACYIATCVYGDYDCPEVWTLRRFRDDTLAATWYGRLFIRVYYAVSPIVVKLFGKTNWFRKFWRNRLDKMVKNLQDKGVENTPYEDKDWRK